MAKPARKATHSVDFESDVFRYCFIPSAIFLLAFYPFCVNVCALMCVTNGYG